MKNRSLVALVLTSVMATGFSTYASAGAISCQSVSSNTAHTTRTWGFDSADACGHGEGNPNSSADIEALGGSFSLASEDWVHQGGISKDGDGSSWLNVSLLPGSSWGGKSISATWTLATGFWDTFGMAVFSVHVGGGSHPDLSDFGAFLITQGEYSGTWTFDQTPKTGSAGGAGGLSNAHLWTAGKPTIVEEPFPVPEPGILMLFASGLLGLAFGNRRKAKA
jgi:hypothetical protein